MSQGIANCYALIEVMNFSLKNYATDKAISKNDKAILRYVRPSNMTPHECTDDLVAISCMVAHIYHESTMKDVFIESIDASIRHSIAITENRIRRET